MRAGTTKVLPYSHGNLLGKKSHDSIAHDLPDRSVRRTGPPSKLWTHSHCRRLHCLCNHLKPFTDVLVQPDVDKHVLALVTVLSDSLLTPG